MEKEGNMPHHTVYKSTCVYSYIRINCFGMLSPSLKVSDFLWDWSWWYLKLYYDLLPISQQSMFWRRLNLSVTARLLSWSSWEFSSLLQSEGKSCKINNENLTCPLYKFTFILCWIPVWQMFSHSPGLDMQCHQIAPHTISPFFFQSTGITWLGLFCPQKSMRILFELLLGSEENTKIK